MTAKTLAAKITDAVWKYGDSVEWGNGEAVFSDLDLKDVVAQVLAEHEAEQAKYRLPDGGFAEPDR